MLTSMTGHDSVLLRADDPPDRHELHHQLHWYDRQMVLQADQ